MRRLITAAALVTLAACGSSAAKPEEPLGLGRPITEAAVANWNIDVTPSGAGLPAGHGSAREGAGVYEMRCAQCHAIPVFPQLSGGIGSLTKFPQKTVGSYWPYAPTLYDYINRAMPPLAPQSLSPSQLYAITAYILSENGIVGRDTEIDRKTLPQVMMPNRNGFTIDKGTPDT